LATPDEFQFIISPPFHYFIPLFNQLFTLFHFTVALAFIKIEKVLFPVLERCFMPILV